ncbi:tetratricopeptide repeat protein [Uliginosibacterium sp. H3]|uniref:Tetratricopeptide repeat protein n=1 Tax=Uliginosibacterium silvisoli TaxID=3114758 RepID=A0ABU6K5S3_9RHOO|nr:tetratricopeptide repeat protein [Uliginosibacterium sp. H3]
MSKRTPPRPATQGKHRPAKADPHAGFLAQAMAAHQQGKLADAERGYTFILDKDPQHFDALHYLGIVKMQLGQTEHGIALVEQALRIRPDAADALSNLSNGLMRARRYDEALACLDRSLTLSPAQPEALTNRGVALGNLGRHEEAAASHARALQIRPAFLEALNNHGNALRALGRFDEALAAYDKALALRAAYPEALNNRGLALSELRRFDEALASHDKALGLRANYPEALNNRGNALKELRRFDEAIASYDQALSLKPDYGEALYNRGNTFSAQNRHAEAVVAYDAALAIQSAYPDAHWNKGISQLLQGQLIAGWQQYEWRWQLKGADAPRDFNCPRWDGHSDIRGQRLLLWAEQGLGDTLQFCRYATLLAQRGVEVILEVQPPLARLLGSLEGATRIVARGDELPTTDLHFPLLSMPMAFNTIVPGIPASVPYLTASGEEQDEWQQRIATLAGDGTQRKQRIGLACSGNPKLANDRNRSIPLEKFLPLLEADASFFLMQKDCRPADAAWLAGQPRIHDLREHFSDFSDTAAALTQLDLLVTVDTSVAHLAGALGTPVALLLPFVPDWRWLLQRNDSPWYPGMRLYRQPAIGDWDSVLAEVRRTALAR